MKSTSMGSLAMLAALPLAAGLQTIANPAVKENYASGEVMNNIMSAKYVSSISFPPLLPPLYAWGEYDANMDITTRPLGMPKEQQE